MDHCVAFMSSGPVHQPFALARIPPALPLYFTPHSGPPQLSYHHRSNRGFKALQATTVPAGEGVG